MKITKSILKRVLYQAHQEFGSSPGDIYKVHALRDYELSEYEKVIKELLDGDYIRESLEPDYFFVTHRGEMFGTSQKCPCRECKPKDYA